MKGGGRPTASSNNDLNTGGEKSDHDQKDHDERTLKRLEFLRKRQQQRKRAQTNEEEKEKKDEEIHEVEVKSKSSSSTSSSTFTATPMKKSVERRRREEEKEEEEEESKGEVDQENQIPLAENIQKEEKKRNLNIQNQNATTNEPLQEKMTLQEPKEGHGKSVSSQKHEKVEKEKGLERQVLKIEESNVGEEKNEASYDRKDKKVNENEGESQKIEKKEIPRKTEQGVLDAIRQTKMRRSSRERLRERLLGQSRRNLTSSSAANTDPSSSENTNPPPSSSVSSNTDPPLSSSASSNTLVPTSRLRDTLRRNRMGNSRFLKFTSQMIDNKNVNNDQINNKSLIDDKTKSEMRNDNNNMNNSNKFLSSDEESMSMPPSSDEDSSSGDESQANKSHQKRRKKKNETNSMENQTKEKENKRMMKILKDAKTRERMNFFGHGGTLSQFFNTLSMLSYDDIANLEFKDVLPVTIQNLLKEELPFGYGLCLPSKGPISHNFMNRCLEEMMIKESMYKGAFNIHVLIESISNLSFGDAVHPVVKVHFVNARTGSYLQVFDKPLYFEDLKKKEIQMAEKDKSGEKDASQEKNKNGDGEGENTNQTRDTKNIKVQYLGCASTAPFPLLHREQQPHWNQALNFPAPFASLLHPDTLVLFEVLDYFPHLTLRKKKSLKGKMNTIAWAFLKPRYDRRLEYQVVNATSTLSTKSGIAAMFENKNKITTTTNNGNLSSPARAEAGEGTPNKLDVVPPSILALFPNGTHRLQLFKYQKLDKTSAIQANIRGLMSKKHTKIGSSLNKNGNENGTVPSNGKFLGGGNRGNLTQKPTITSTSARIPSIYIQYLMRKREKWPSYLNIQLQPSLTSSKYSTTKTGTLIPKITLSQNDSSNSLNNLQGPEIEESNENDLVSDNKGGADENEKNVDLNELQQLHLHVNSSLRQRDYHEPCLIPNKLLHRLNVGMQGATALAFAPGNKSILAIGCCSSNNLFHLRLYDINSGSLKEELLPPHRSIIHSIRWTDCGRYLISASGDGTAHVWWITHDIDEENRNVHFADVEYDIDIDVEEMDASKENGILNDDERNFGNGEQHDKDDNNEDNRDENTNEYKVDKDNSEKKKHNLNRKGKRGLYGLNIKGRNLILGKQDEQSKIILPKLLCVLHNTPPTFVYSVLPRWVNNELVILTGCYDRSIRLWRTNHINFDAVVSSYGNHGNDPSSKDGIDVSYIPTKDPLSTLYNSVKDRMEEAQRKYKDNGINGDLVGYLGDIEQPHLGNVNAIEEDFRTGRIYTACSKGLLLVWKRIGEGIEHTDYSILHRIRNKDFIGKCITDIHIHPTRRKSQLLVMGHQHMLRLLDLYSYRLVNAGYIGTSCSMNRGRSTFSADGSFVICGNDDGKIRIWDTQTAKHIPCTLSQQLGFPRTISDIVWHPNQHVCAIAAYGDDMPVLVYYANKSESSSINRGHSAVGGLDMMEERSILGQYSNRSKSSKRYRNQRTSISHRGAKTTSTSGRYRSSSISYGNLSSRSSNSSIVSTNRNTFREYSINVNNSSFPTNRRRSSAKYSRNHDGKTTPPTLNEILALREKRQELGNSIGSGGNQSFKTLLNARRIEELRKKTKEEDTTTTTGVAATNTTTSNNNNSSSFTATSSRLAELRKKYGKG